MTVWVTKTPFFDVLYRLGTEAFLTEAEALAAGSTP